jgi:hypothetical protein
MARDDRSLMLAGLGAMVAISAQTPADAALAPLPDRPIARVDRIKTDIRKALDIKVEDAAAGAVLVQWPNWRKF